MVNEFHEPATGGDPSKLEIGRHAARAAAWRSAASFWPPLKELASLALRFRSRLQSRLDLAEDGDDLRSAQDKLLKRLQFLKWEYESFLSEPSRAKAEAVDSLFEFFYERAGFRLGQDLDSHLLDSALSSREVAPPMGAMFLQILAEGRGPSVEILNLQAGRYLRSGNQLFDLFDQGRRLSATERLELAQDSLSTSAHPPGKVNAEDLMMANLVSPSKSSLPSSPEGKTLDTPFDFKELSALTPDRAYVLVLTRLRQLSTKLSPSVIECELMLLDELIRSAPSQVALLAERGVLRSRLQQWQGALDDLNRFFAFQRREEAPAALVELHDQLRREISRDPQI